MSEHVDLSRLSRKERRILAANQRKWARKLRPFREAIEASTRITAEDLAVTIGQCPIRTRR